MEQIMVAVDYISLSRYRKQVYEQGLIDMERSSGLQQSIIKATCANVLSILDNELDGLRHIMKEDKVRIRTSDDVTYIINTVADQFIHVAPGHDKENWKKYTDMIASIMDGARRGLSKNH
ncbi:hypothetical protein [Gorillibacterium sp. CAU 1737]|uniref:hypothetical protein n=1 Tax=Gorillibacterium sp. CAU 1737 TaxID=3140362 RepID=UPI0032600B41